MLAQEVEKRSDARKVVPKRSKSGREELPRTPARCEAPFLDLFGASCASTARDPFGTSFGAQFFLNCARLSSWLGGRGRGWRSVWCEAIRARRLSEALVEGHQLSPRRGSLAGRDGVVRRSPGVHVCAPASRIQHPVLTSWHAEHRHDPIPRAISIRSTAGHVPLGRAPSRAQHHGVPGTLKPRLQPWDAKIRMRVCLCIDATQLAEHGVVPLGHRGRLMPLWPEGAFWPQASGMTCIWAS